MLFTSYEFLFFLFSCFILYYVIPKKYQWILLLIASYGFYFSAGPTYPLFLFATTVITYVTALFIEKKKKEEKEYLKLHSKEFSSREETAVANVCILVELKRQATFFCLMNEINHESFLGIYLQRFQLEPFVPS